MSSASESPHARHKIRQGRSSSCPRIALLSPYSGGNFGDAAIQDAMIANIALRLPNAQISGISLNCDNFTRRHGVARAFPLLAHIRMYGIFDPGVGQQPTTKRDNKRGGNKWLSAVKQALKKLPVVWQCLKVLARCSIEAQHFVQGLRFIRTQDLLVVSGGGQLEEVYEGPWRHPFGLFKWAVLARFARVPYVVVSVGAGKVASTTSRLLLSAALRMARYRSYRDENSKKVVVARLLGRAASDRVVPDLAFSLPSSELPSAASIRAIAGSRIVVAISPIAIGKPGYWPTADLPLYDRYLNEMAQVISQLLRRDCFLVLVISSLDEDQLVIPELLGRLDDESRERLAGQIHIAANATWQEFVATLRDVDLLVASRLHSTILGFMSETPTVAISSGAKVDAVMSDLGQTDYLLQIRDFTSKDVIQALDRLELRRDVVLQQIASYRRQMISAFALQYDTLAELAMASSRGHK
jgi:polysaccharide pyruvyl transferase WcaK-like protein